MDVRRFADAAAFLEALDLCKGDWPSDSALESPWTFRGQANTSWPLMPSAWRQDAEVRQVLDPLLEEARKLNLGCGEEFKEPTYRLLAETAAVRAFQGLSDELGLRLPSPNPFHGRDVSGNVLSDPFLPRPNDPITGLAQHHGIPTRLLDWTRRPSYAAFFAAEDPQEKAKGKDLAVWACRTDRLVDGWAEIVTCPRSENVFLHAQDGLFLLHKDPATHFVTHGTWPTLNVLVQPEGIRKYVLAGGCREELLRRLWKNRVSRAHLMPSFAGAAAALRMRWTRLRR